MSQAIPRRVRVAAEAVRSTCGACQKQGREIGCDYCFSKRYRGCVYLAQIVVDALSPSPGSNGDGGDGIKQRKVA